MEFEEAMEKLESITQDLEEGNLSLEDSLRKFEEGTRLVRFCEKKLEEIEKRISVLMKEANKLKLKSWQPVTEEKGQDVFKVNAENGLLFTEDSQNDAR